MSDRSPDLVSRPELAALTAILAAFVLVRIPLLSPDMLVRGWDSDEAIGVLMGKRMVESGRFSIFFWGQSYLGTLNSAVAGMCGSLLRPFVDEAILWQLAGRIAVVLQVGAGIVCWWGGIRLAWGRAAALLVAALLTVGPRDLFFTSVIPHGAEMSFLLCGVIFWFLAWSLTRGRGLRDRGELFVFGFLAGFGWWMNQGTIFPVAAALGLAIGRSEWYGTVRARLLLADRFLVREERLGWRGLPGILRLLVLAANFVLAILLVPATLRYFGIQAPTFDFGHPFLEPLGSFAVIQVALSLVFGGAAGALFRALRRAGEPGTREAVKACAAFVTGAICAYLPPLAGKLAGLVPSSYGLSVPLRTPQEVLPAVATLLRIDFWRFLGVTWTAAGAIFGIVIVAFLLSLTWEARGRLLRLLGAEGGPFGIRDVAGATILLCLVFYVFSQRSHPGSVRYVVAALPLTYAFFAEALFRVWRETPRFRVAVAAGLVAALLSVGTAGARVAGEIASDHDERPDLARIAAGGYRVCYATYWVSYRLQFLSGESVGFIPYRSYDRNRPESRVLAASPGRKCLIRDDGTIRDYLPSDAVGRPLR